MWLDLLGLTEYDDVIHSRGVTGQLLMDLQTKDILVRIAILHVHTQCFMFHAPCFILPYPMSHSPIFHTPIPQSQYPGPGSD